MAFELQITPHGRVIPQRAEEDAAWTDRVCSRFHEHEAAGLLSLAAGTLPPEASASLRFWREIVAEFVRTLCHLPEGEAAAVKSLPPPSPAVLAEWTLNAPPMPGAEYLTPALLESIWNRLSGWTFSQVSEIGSLKEFLDAYAPTWNRVGRVTLHLAENKQDPDYPFAFMATYAAGISSGGRVRRLPLDRALREYAGARRRNELLKLLEPLHRAAEQSEWMAELVESGEVFHALMWTPADAYRFLCEIPKYQECGLLTQLPNWWKKRPRARVRATLEGNQKRSVLNAEALLHFRVELAMGDTPLDREEVKALLESSEGLVRLRGEWVEANGEKLREALAHWKSIETQTARDGLSFIEGMRLLAGAPTKFDTSAESERDGERKEWSFLCAGDRLRELLSTLREPSRLHESPPAAFRGTLRHYQHDGLNWLWFCKQLGLGTCLADDMGLGKTIQVLAALLRHQAREKGSSAPALLAAPASLIGNWKSETERFAPSLHIFIAHPSETPKATLETVAADPKNALRSVDLVITTYAMIQRLPWLNEMAWHWVILDEAQAIKNPSARQTRAIKKLRAEARTALTGTPVENRLGDLWSIFDFLNPGLLGNARAFKSFAKGLGEPGHAGYAPLRKLVAPYILRRLKTDPAIVPELPEKTEMQVYCGLSSAQAVLYRQGVAALERALKTTHGEAMRRRGMVLSYLMRFKQICNHPSQLTGDGMYAAENSGKFQRLGMLCGEIGSRGEKALVFTQFREMTEPLADYLAGVFGRPGLILHGGTPLRQRKQRVAEFQREEGPPFFVLSLKAGGTGLNLTAASHVIHVDRWWNPAVENQATDRAFRIGQQRNVLVHKFVTRGTVEERIDELIREKQAMADSLLDGGAEKALTEMSNEEILDLVALDLDHAKG